MGDPFGMQDDTSWEPASVDMPPMPTIAPGEDAMSMTIAAVLPTLSAPLAANVTALQAKETMFSGKVSSAKSAYQNSDDQGGQGIGQLGQMLGQLGQMAGKAGGGGGGGGGMFGSLMEQAMKTAQSGGSQGGSSGAGAQSSAGQPTAGQGSGSAPQQVRDDAPAAAGQEQAPHEDRAEREEREQREEREERQRLDHAAPGAAPNAAGPAPVAPPEQSRPAGGEDLSRRV